MARILVLDDSKAVLDQVSGWLSEVGHEVKSLQSANSVERLLHTERFDLVITDIFMPELDGLELLGILRRAQPGLPCIAMSSITGSLSQLPIARALGAVSTLTKPFQSFHLYAAVTVALHPKSPQGGQPFTGLQS
jgi:CheY-like chemotaxis protein